MCSTSTEEHNITTHQLVIEMSNNCVRIAFKKYYSFVNIMIKSFDKKVPTHHL